MTVPPVNAEAFHADQPVEEPSQDAYSRYPFAEGIAKAITKLPTGECYVIGLHGPWGDGKTSVLQFIKHALRGEASTVVHWYNPWRFANEDAMLRGFFAAFASVIEVELKTAGEQLADKLAQYSDLLALVHEKAGKAGEALSKKGQVPLEALRVRLFQGLRKANKRIVLFIDDIDRLDASETASLFRLIKACADFPNVVYVLAFDREMVAKTVGRHFGDGSADSGRRFLEKIIQIPLSLPPASRRDLDRACMSAINELLILAKLTLSDSDQLRWQMAYQAGISRRLRTPRQVSHYLNAVRFALPLLANEVDTVDLLLVEGLRVCFPAAYEIIRANQDIFIGLPDNEMERQHGGAPHDSLFAAATEGLGAIDSAILGRLVEVMFPRYHLSKKGLQYGYEMIRQWNRDRLVCSPAYGPRYFSYVIGSSDVADLAVQAIIDAASGTETTLLRTLIDQQLDSLKQAMLVAKLADRILGVSPGAAERLAVMLATLSDRFAEPFSLQSGTHAGIATALLTVHLCGKIEPASARLAAARQVIDQAPDMWFVAAFMRSADPAFTDPNKAPELIPGDDLRRLRDQFIQRYERYASTQDGTRMFDLLRRWKFEMSYSVTRAASKQFLQDRLLPRIRSNGNTAIELLQCLAQPLMRIGEIVPTPGDLHPQDLDELAALVDLDATAKAIIDNWVPEPRQKGPADWPTMPPGDRILAQFWHIYTHREPSAPNNTPSQ